jgi:uncharacterized membrane protein YhaH (DUF805 family)
VRRVLSYDDASDLNAVVKRGYSRYVLGSVKKAHLLSYLLRSYEAIKMQWFMKCLNQYADFSGRARRQEYWMFSLFYMIFVAAAVIVDVILSMPIFTLLFMLGVMIPSLSVMVRRLHDTDRSGWWCLVTLVPFVGGFILLFFLCVEGTQGVNRFGSNPKAS